MSQRAVAKIEGLQPLLRRIDRLQTRVRTKTLRKMVTVGGRVVLKLAKSRAPKRTKTGNVTVVGVLRKAMGQRVKRGNDGTYYAVIGPRRGRRTQVGVRRRPGRKSRAGDPIFQDPAKIAHLVEDGHGGPHGAAPHPFMRPAYDEGKGPATKAMADVAAEAIKEA